jgi:arabinogalactan endo-1,4-beta-galactosidase
VKTKHLLLAGLLICSGIDAQTFYRGGDLSYVNELEDSGVLYYNENLQQVDPYELMADKGANIARFRLWHNPQWTNYSNITDVKKSIARAKAANMSVILDFQYSDFWADPGRQWRPASWNDISDDAVLGDSLYNYTYNTLLELSNEGLLPDFVQIGNEINGNILIKRTSQNIDDKSPGMSPINWSRQVSLLNRGIDAVQQINTELDTNVRTIIHVAQPENAIWWFNSAVSNGLTAFDIIGLSYYPQWSSLDIRGAAADIKFLKDTYNKDVMIVETGYPWTTSGDDGAGNVLGNDSKMPIYNNTLSNETQRDFLIELSYLTKINGGIGIVYWEPAWVSSTCQTYWATGSHFENAALFDFDNKINIGAEYLSYNLDEEPAALQDREVTFKVNMTGVDTSNGVYVTGDFTGTTWTFKEMQQVSTNIFQYTGSIPGRSSGAFIYYKNNVWNNSYRETVPTSCDIADGTFREYAVKDAPITYFYDWGKCTSSNPPSATENNLILRTRIYPTLANNSITIENTENVTSLSIMNSNGETFPVALDLSGNIDIQSLIPGVYFLRVNSLDDTFTFKFIKQ